MSKELTENGILTPVANRNILPVMTALFVKGLGSNHTDIGIEIETLEKEAQGKKQARIFRLPIDPVAPPSLETGAERHGYARKQVDLFKDLKNATCETESMRSLIRGISNHFNNLLMGIWGNVSLMRLQLKETDPLFERVSQLEYLVQSGAHLIHLVLGYLGERRVVARRLRLNQLTAQVNKELPEDHTADMELDLERVLEWASRVQRPRVIAASTARVMGIFLKSIQFHCSEISNLNGHDPAVQKKGDTICKLVLRGLAITDRLDMYAADARPNARRVGIQTMLKRLTTQTRRQNPGIDVRCQISRGLPMARGERSRLEWVFNQLTANAVEAMPDGGTLEISACTLQEKSPHTRCGVQKGSDYVVIAFKDTGCGMSAELQKQIFDPFFTTPQKCGHLGLGLASAAGVLKSHNGYIQLLSRERAGSTFSVYLPIAGAAIQGQQVKTKR